MSHSRCHDTSRTGTNAREHVTRETYARGTRDAYCPFINLIINLFIHLIALDNHHQHHLISMFKSKKIEEIHSPHIAKLIEAGCVTYNDIWQIRLLVTQVKK